MQQLKQFPKETSDSSYCKSHEIYSTSNRNFRSGAQKEASSGAIKIMKVKSGYPAYKEKVESKKQEALEHNTERENNILETRRITDPAPSLHHALNEISKKTDTHLSRAWYLSERLKGYAKLEEVDSKIQAEAQQTITEIVRQISENKDTHSDKVKILGNLLKFANENNVSVSRETMNQIKDYTSKRFDNISYCRDCDEIIAFVVKNDEAENLTKSLLKVRDNRQIFAYWIRRIENNPKILGNFLNKMKTKDRNDGISESSLKDRIKLLVKALTFIDGPKQKKLIKQTGFEIIDNSVAARVKKIFLKTALLSK